MLRRTKVPVRLARDFLRHPQYYSEYPPTVAEVSRRLYVSSQALKSFLLSNPIPGLSVDISVQEHRGRYLPAYRIYVHDPLVARNFFKEFLHV
jgi:hypothetical protein